MASKIEKKEVSKESSKKYHSPIPPFVQKSDSDALKASSIKDDGIGNTEYSGETFPGGENYK